MAATSMPIATLTALDVLRAGGNALDAAIAAVAVLGVVEPQSTGIGGDCFCLYAPAGAGKVIALNGSGRAPAAATPEALRSRGVDALTPTSPHSVTVPGELLRPAIRCAEEGWPVHARVALDWTNAAEKLRNNEASRRRFLLDGEAPPVGHRFVQPELGRTLRAVAERGPRAFYEGEIAAAMVSALRDLRGLHTEADFAAGLHAAEFV